MADSFNATGFVASRGKPDAESGTDGAFARAPGWNLELSTPSVAFTTEADPALFHGVASQKLALTGQGSGGLSNRGLGNAGMVFGELQPNFPHRISSKVR